MEEIVKEIIEQAEDERNFTLICLVRDILAMFATTINCPVDWRCIGRKLAMEYDEDSWMYDNLDLHKYVDQVVK